jgi:hypothetical protein
MVRHDERLSWAGVIRKAAPWAPHSKELVRSLDGAARRTAFGGGRYSKSGAVGAALQKACPFAGRCGTTNGFRWRAFY